MQQTSSTSGSKYSNLWKSVAFLAGLAMLLGAAQFVFLPRHDRDKLWSDYLALPEGSVDVLFLGTSLVHANINPVVLWEAAGIRSYDLSGSEQSLLTTLPYLREALSTQAPRVVVVDLHMFSLTNWPLSENQKRSNFTMMPMGTPKLSAVTAGSPAREWTSYLVPLELFHSRWDELRFDDYNVYKWGDPANNTFLGYRKADKTVPQQPSYDRRPLDDVRYVENYELVSDIVELAEEAGAEVLLLIGPGALVSIHDDWTERLVHDVSRDHADVRILEAQYRTAEMDVDYAVDYYDQWHLNARGAEKYSAWLAGQLSQLYALPNEPSAHLDRAWQDELGRYRESLGD